MVCLRAVIGQFAAAVVVLYRHPGSQSVPQKFFDELAAILDRVATHQEAIYIVGDFNIRLDRTDDTYADQLRLLVDCYGLVLHDTEPTHQLGGTLDAVITHDVTGRPFVIRESGLTIIELELELDRVAVEDVGLSDHFLLRWKVNTTKDARPLRPSTVVRGANWTWSRSDRRYPHRGCASQLTGLLTLMS